MRNKPKGNQRRLEMNSRAILFISIGLVKTEMILHLEILLKLETFIEKEIMRFEKCES